MDNYTAESAFANDLIDGLLADNIVENNRDPVEWIQREFYIPELNGPIVLYPHQIATIRESLSVDENGLFKYDLIIWSDIKKSAKSTISGAIVLWRAISTPNGRFRIVANDLKQAASRVFDAICVCLDMNKKLGAQFSRTKYELIHLPTGSKIEAVPVDPKGEAGSGDDITEYTEVHMANNAAAQKMWTETTLSPLKFGKSFRLLDTYAGFVGESPILEPLYAAIVKPENRISETYPIYAVGRSFSLWNCEPRLPWQTPAYYESEARVLTPNEFSRIHRNQWVSSTTTFIPIELWDACKGDLPAWGRFKEIVIAMDAAVSNDCFAMVAMSRHGNLTAVRYARKWAPPTGGVIQYRNPEDPTDRNYPEGELRWLVNNYNVVIITYDPYQLHSFVMDLKIEGIAAFEEFNQEKPRLIADKAFYDNIRDRQIIHDGNPDLREHIQNANSTAEDKNTLRIVKRAQHLKIDLTVASSMCNDRARWYLPE